MELTFIALTISTVIVWIITLLIAYKHHFNPLDDHIIYCLFVSILFTVVLVMMVYKL